LDKWFIRNNQAAPEQAPIRSAAKNDHRLVTAGRTPTLHQYRKSGTDEKAEKHFRVTLHLWLSGRELEFQVGRWSDVFRHNDLRRFISPIILIGCTGVRPIQDPEFITEHLQHVILAVRF
jgi:hypothetical protein